MPKLEEILKKRGWTDEDLKAQEALLANPRFRDSLESEYDSAARDRDAALQLAEETEKKWNDWRDSTAVPTIDAYAKDTMEAKAEAAALKAKLEMAEKAGFLPGGTPPDPAQPTPPTQPTFDPKAHNVPTWDDIKRITASEGDAIALANDLAAEYAHLTGGGTLFDYQGQNGQRGMRALRAEAMQARQPLYDYVAKKFDFQGKRTAIETKRQQEHDEAMRKEGESRVIAQYGNPALRAPMPSRHASMFGPKEEQSKQPWQENANDLRERRLERALQTELKSQRVQ